MLSGAGNDVGDWAIRAIAADEAGARFYLDQLRPFRLAALKRDPDAFGSNYAREAAFSNDDWLGRLHNPLTKTFVAVKAEGILASTTLAGPVPSTTEEARFLEEVGETGPTTMAVYHVMGVATSPESRGRGVAKALLGAALKDLAERLQGCRASRCVCGQRACKSAVLGCWFCDDQGAEYLD